MVFISSFYKLEMFETKTSTLLSRFFKKKSTIYTLKILLFASFCGIIYYYITQKEDVNLIYKEFIERCKSGPIYILFIALLLLPVNWGIEIIKWQYLTSPFQKLNWKKATLSVLAGVTFSIYTPARLGDIGGRLLVIQPKHIGKAFLATLLGSFSQLVILISSGIVALLYYVRQHTNISNQLYLLIIIGGALMILGMALTYWNIHFISFITDRIKLPKKIKQIINVLQSYSLRQLNYIFFLSVSRYFIYSTQAVLLFIFLGINASIVENYTNTSLTYLCQTAIPIPAFLDLPLRGGISMGIWEYADINPLIISASPFILWVINICIPAGIGMILLSLYNRTKTKRQ